MVEKKEKRRQLEELLKSDEIFMVYRRTNDDYASEFDSITALMPEKTRNVLCGYADSAQQMLQRALTLLSEHWNDRD